MLRSAVIALSLFIVAPAHAALDELCGKTITEDLILDHDIDCTGYTTPALIIGADGVTIDGAGYRIMAPDSSRAISVENRSNVTIQNIELAGWCSGIGIYINGGSNHVIANVIANNRATGVSIIDATGVSVTGLTARNAASYGLQLLRAQLPITLADLDLNDNATGLYLGEITGPLTIDTTSITSVRGCEIGIQALASSDLTFKDLSIDAGTYGIHAASIDNHTLTFQALDLTGRTGTGTGLYLSGDGHTVEDLVVNRRATGVYINSADNFALRRLKVRGASSSGLALSNLTAPFELTDLSLIDSTNGLALGPLDVPGLEIGPYDPDTGSGAITDLRGNVYSVSLSSVKGLTLHDLDGLDGTTAGVYMANPANSDIYLANLDVSGRYPVGSGVIFSGTGHMLDTVTADRRANGVVDYAKGVTLRHLTSRRSATGVFFSYTVSSAADLPTLDDLVLTDNENAIHLNTMFGTAAVPFVLHDQQNIDFTGSRTGISIYNSAYIHIHDLTLANDALGINASQNQNHHLTFERLDLSGSGRGSGMSLYGPDHVLRDITAHRREYYGAYLNRTSNVSITNFAAHKTAYGLAILDLRLNEGDTAPSLEDLDLQNNDVGLWFEGIVAAAAPGPTLVNGSTNLDVRGSELGLLITKSRNVRFADMTLATACSGIEVAGANRSRLPSEAITLDNLTFPSGARRSPACNGISLYDAKDVRLQTITARDRDTGVRALNTSGLVIDGLLARGNGTGLRLDLLPANATGPSLAHLDLQGNNTGIAIDRVKAPTVIDGDAVIDLDNSASSAILVTNTEDLTVRDLAITTPQYGIYSYGTGTGNARQTYENVTLTGHGRGRGFYLGADSNNIAGPNHVLRNVRAEHFEYGLFSTVASGLTVEDSTFAYDYIGVYLNGPTSPSGFAMPVIDAVTLTDNSVGLSLQNHRPSAAFTIDGASLASLERTANALTLSNCTNLVVRDLAVSEAGVDTTAGNATGVRVNGSSAITLKNLVLPYPIGVAGSNNTTLLLEDLTLLGPSTGYGVQLGDSGNPAGADLVLKNVTTRWHSTGVYARQASNLTLDGVAASHNWTGIVLIGASAVRPTLTGLALDDNSIALTLDGVVGTAALPIELGATALTSFSGNDVGINLTNNAAHVHLHHLATPLLTRSYGIRATGASTTGLRINNVDVSGHGFGWGISATGSGLVIDNVTANQRRFGVELSGATNPTVTNVSAAANYEAGIQLSTTNAPFTLSGLALVDNVVGLHLGGATGSATIGTATLPTHSGNTTAIVAPANITVDAANLGLTQTGNDYTEPVPASDPRCGTTLSGITTLAADLDCRGTTGTAITLAAGATLDGAGHRILAPRATTAIYTAQSNTTIKNVDVSGVAARGEGVRVAGGTSVRVENVTANRRAYGFVIASATGVTLQGLTADNSTTGAIVLANLSPPLTLGALSARHGGGTGLQLYGYDASATPLTLGAASITTLADHATSLSFGGGPTKGISVVGPINGLDGLSTGIAMQGNSEGHTFDNLDLSARWPAGTGISVQGKGHVLEDLTVLHRETGVWGNGDEGSRYTRLTLRYAVTAALNLSNVKSPTLQDLTLEHSGSALYLINIAAGAAVPTLTSAAFTSTKGSVIGVNISGSTGLTLQGLTLPNVGFGVTSDDASSALTVRDLDVSGTRHAGTGIHMRGSGHHLEGITSNDRSNGALLYASNTTLSGLEVDRASNRGLVVAPLDPTLPLALSGLALTRSYIGLDIGGSYPSATPLVVGPQGASATAVQVESLAESGTGIVLSNPLANVIVQDLSFTNPAALIVHGGSSNVTLRRLSLDGGSGGYWGFQVYGTGHVIEDVLVQNHSRGIGTYPGASVTLRRITADHNAEAGVSVDGPAEVTLIDISARRNTTGVRLYQANDVTLAPVGAGSGPIRDLSGNDTGIYVQSSAGVTVRDLGIDATNIGLHIYNTNSGLHAERLTFAPGGRRATYGIYASGGQHDVDTIDCVDTSICVRFDATRGDSLSNLSATGCGVGLYLASTPNDATTYTVPTLSALNLRNNTTAVSINNWQLPLTIDAAVGLDTTGSDQGVRLGGNIANLTLRGLVLNNPGAGVTATDETHTNLLFEDLDVSGPGGGTGIYLPMVTSSTLRDLTADDRANGYNIGNHGAEDLHLDNVSAAGCSNSGMLIRQVQNVAPTIRGLHLNDNNYGLSLMDTSFPFTLDGEAMGIDLSGSLNGIQLQNVSGLTFANFTLDNFERGFYAPPGYTNNNVTLRDVDASGSGLGIGLYLDSIGTGWHLERVTADSRADGINVAPANGLTMIDVHVGNASGYALILRRLTVDDTAPVLDNVMLVDSTWALALSEFTQPGFVFNGDGLSDLTGNTNGIQVLESADLTLRDLYLPSIGTSIRGDWTNRRLSFEDIDLTGYCRGTGLSLEGNDHHLDGVVAGQRATGLSFASGTRMTIENSVFGANANYGIQLVPVANDATVASDEAYPKLAANTATTFKVLPSWAYMAIGMPLRFDLPGGPEYRNVKSRSSGGAYFLTLDAPLSTVPPAGTNIHLDYDGTRVDVSNSDICANGTGVLGAGFLASAEGNYWRAVSGPTHSGNPGGSGDKVNATNTTYTPFVVVPTDKRNVFCNQYPIANAGPDQAVCEGDTVILDASASYDPDIEPIYFDWRQLAGSSVAAVTLSDATVAQPSFTAPAPASDPAVLVATTTFEVEVDDLDLQRADRVAVAITRRNPKPVADAGTPRAVVHQSLVTLDASASTDPDGLTLSYAWTQVAGPAVTLTGATSATPSFTAPTVAQGQQVALTFQVTVSDTEPVGYCGGPSQATATVTVTVTNFNEPPIADAGDDTSVAQQSVVTLDGSESYDPNDDPLTFAWTQTAGSAVTLTGANGPTPTFTAPTLACGDAIDLTFRLVVNDGRGGSDDDNVTLHVGATMDTPDLCDGIDNNCDGATDEDANATLADDCWVGEGACETKGHESCVGGAVTCDGTAGTPSAERCGDTVDNDCDGETDEGFADWIGVACDATGTTAEDADRCFNDGYVCDVATGTIVCASSGPNPELCDDIDNDCDGQNNEGFTFLSATNVTLPVGAACDGPDGDVCSTGHVVCASTTTTACDDDSNTTAERCNGIDDDCDGATDEDWKRGNSNGFMGITDGDGRVRFLYEDCDGSNDEDLCERGKIECDIGFTTVYCHEQNTGTVELCDAAAQDEDCDGEHNEGFYLGSECTTGGVGACAVAGVYACSSDLTTSVCTAAVGGTPSAETCDGVDNDCDGTTDEDVCAELDTRIVTGPPSPTALTSASFTFVNPLNPDHTTFECNFDGRAWARCDGGTLALSSLLVGQHTVLVRAIRVADGGFDSTPAYWSWRIDKTAPDTVIVAAPADPAQSTGATFQFASPTPDPDYYSCALDVGPAGTCPTTGAPAYARCDNPRTFDALAEGSHTLCVYVTNIAGTADMSPARHTWVIDLSAPETAIVAPIPAQVTAATTITLHYEDPTDPTRATFECSLDGGAWRTCDDHAVSYRDLADGPHTFMVRALDRGVFDPTPAFFAWAIDRTAPCVTIAIAPANPSQSGSATFVFTSAEPADYLCRLDGAPEAPCPTTFEGLADGAHDVTVYARDAAGNSGRDCGATHHWVVDLRAPETEIVAGPELLVGAAEAVHLDYIDPTDATRATFECTLDGGAWVACDEAGVDYAALPIGRHDFAVRACDAVGCDPTPATQSWVVTASSCPNDQVPPTLVCRDTYVGECVDGGAEVLAALIAPTVEDACGPVTVTNNAASYDAGETAVVFTATDGNGNVSSCLTLVDVRDTQPPTIVCPADVAVTVDATCTASPELGQATGSDACSGTELRQLHDAPAVFGLGESAVTHTVIDAAGNVARCTQKVTLTDVDAAVLECPAAITVDAPADACAWTGTQSAQRTDNCEAAVQVDVEGTYPIGTSALTFTSAGSSGTSSCATTITVRDLTPPTITCGTPVGAAPTIATAVAEDACGVVVSLDNVRCQRLRGAIVEDLAACPATFTNDSVMVMDGLADGELVIRYDATATDAANNTATIPCELRFEASGACGSDDIDEDGIFDLCDPSPYDGLHVEGSGGCTTGGAPLLLGLAFLLIRRIDRNRRTS